MVDFLSPRITLIALTGFFTLVSVALQAIHTTIHCTYDETSADLKTCYDNLPEGVCGKPAYDINKSYTIGDQNVDVNLSCPWSLLAVVIGYISAAILLLYLVMMAFSKRPNRNFLVVFRMLSMLGFVATAVFMIYDLMIGYDQYVNEKWGGVSFTQVVYIITVVFVGLTLVGNIMLSFFGTKPDEKLENEFTNDLGSVYVRTQ